MKKRFHKSGQPQQRIARDAAPREHSVRDAAPQRDQKSRDPKSHDHGQRPHRQGDNRRPDAKSAGFKHHERRDAAPAAAKLTGPLLWGLHAVRAAWLNPKRQIIRLLVTDSGLETFEETLAEAKAAGIKRPQPEVTDKNAYDRLMPAGAVHQGVAALVEPLETRDAHDLIAGVKEGEKSIIVILDQVTDPHNVGAILRSAAAFGCTGVIMQDRHAPELTGVLAKTASGAADVIPVAVETNLSRAIEQLQESGYFVIGLDERGTPLSQQPSYERVALVLGAEGAGLRRLVAEHCDGLASLPTQAPIYSLNVSNAAAVALYALKVAG